MDESLTMATRYLTCVALVMGIAWMLVITRSEWRQSRRPAEPDRPRRCLGYVLVESSYAAPFMAANPDCMPADRCLAVLRGFAEDTAWWVGLFNDLLAAATLKHPGMTPLFYLRRG